jgi:hypothetical protein
MREDEVGCVSARGGEACEYQADGTGKFHTAKEYRLPGH